MKKSCSQWKVLVVCVFTTLFLGCDGTESTGLEVPVATSLNGQLLVFTGGSPIAGATITADRPNIGTVSDVTDQNGQFSFVQIPDNTQLSADLPDNGGTVIYNLAIAQNLDSDFIQLFTTPVSGSSASGLLKITPETQITGFSGSNYFDPNPPNFPLGNVGCFGDVSGCEVDLSGVIATIDQSRSVYIFGRSITQDGPIRIQTLPVVANSAGEWTRTVSLRSINSDEPPELDEVFEIGVVVTESPINGSQEFLSFDVIPGGISIAPGGRLQAIIVIE